jgi:hypothetical protein
MRAGFAFLVAGLLLDAGYHISHGVGAHPASIPCCGAGFWAHAVTLAGMALSIGAVVQAAVRSSRRSGLRRRERSEHASR